MKSKLSMQSLIFLGVMLIALSLSAEQVDHSSMHHEHGGDMHHQSAQQAQKMHEQHHVAPGAEDHMKHEKHESSGHESSGHRAGSGEHHNHGSQHSHDSMGVSGKSMHKSGQHGMHGDAMKFQGHEHHAKSGDMKMKSKSLGRLQQMPDSGKSREADFDGRYTMESTTIDASVATQCAQASRGLIMVDNATWAKCGGKPVGWSKGIGDASAMEHSEHMGH